MRWLGLTLLALVMAAVAASWVLSMMAWWAKASRTGRDRRRRGFFSRYVFLKRAFRKPLRPIVGAVTVRQSPYRFADFGRGLGEWFDLSTDADPTRLERWGLPVLRTPEDLAHWLGIPLNRLAWLTHRCRRGKPESQRQSHYHYAWRAKRNGGVRLIEAPKKALRAVQQKLLQELLERVPVSDQAHGFCKGRSIRTNAAIHRGAAVILKFDLENFYTNIGFNRVVAIYRALGFSREVALWLARLTTTAAAGNLPFPTTKTGQIQPYQLTRYTCRHLPQGAPTSPALANLSAFWLDRRLSGLARSFGLKYTRYGDDLTFSGGDRFSAQLRIVIQLAQQIIRQEGFRSHRKKRRILRRHQRQIVTGVVVNQRLNVPRPHYDRLKALLHNCRVHGPTSQNRSGHPEFAAHVRGQIAHVMQLHPARGQKLLQQYQQIDWSR